MGTIMYRLAMRNVLLSCILLASSVSLASCKDKSSSSSEAGTSSKKADKPEKPSEEALIKEALAVPGAMIIDVRSANEFAGGHVEGAVHIPVLEIEDRIAETQPNKDTQIILYCHRGPRAANAEKRLRAMGYTKLLNAKAAKTVAKAMGKELVK
ncbi:MAG: rhodanese-like domain-containing protein [Myxococcales bacterium]|nr:rhodanese-like domain-containing protein [Myxococcales bacterium]